LDSENVYRELGERYRAVLGRVRDAERAAGRPGGEVTVLPAVKYADAGQIAYLYAEEGLRDIGENRVQTMLEHLAGLGAAGGAGELRTHFIGSLQRNKVRYVAGKVALVHSLDSAGLASDLSRAAMKLGTVQDVLVEINSGREEGKGGVMPEAAADFCGALAGFPGLRLRGFMTMGPAGLSQDGYYNIFTETYRLALDIWTKILHNIDGPVLSMGMSDSFVPAVAAGATVVRIGRAVFGGPTAPAGAVVKGN
jgi:pyridoxal phosphate enzyme (YggS family)